MYISVFSGIVIVIGYNIGFGILLLHLGKNTLRLITFNDSTLSNCTKDSMCLILTFPVRTGKTKHGRPFASFRV